MTGIEIYWTGNEKWLTFVKHYKEYSRNEESHSRIADIIGGDEDIAIVICGIFGDKSGEKWLYSKIPALAGLTPLECLEKGLERRVKVALMRMPV